MTKSNKLIEIAKANGAFIVKDEIGEDLVLPVSELQDVINAYNAQNKGALECRFTYLVSELKRLLGLDENYMCLSSAPVEPVLLNFLTEKLNVMNAQNGEAVCWAELLDNDILTGMTKEELLTYGVQEYNAIPLYTAPQTLPPEWAEYVGRLEKALNIIVLSEEPNHVADMLSTKGMAITAKQALATKPKDR